MRKRRFIVVLILVLLAGAGGGWGWWRDSRKSADPDPEWTVGRGEVTLKVAETGTLEAESQVEVKSQVAGKLLRLTVNEGDWVKQGDLIAQLDATELKADVSRIEAQIAAAGASVQQAQHSSGLTQEQVEAQVNQARAALESSRVRLKQAQERAENQPKLSESSVQQAQAALHSAEENLRAEREAAQPQRLAEAKAAYDQTQANLERAEKEWRRQQELLAQGFVSQSQVERAKNDYEVAAAQHRSAQERQRTVEAEVAARERSARAAVEQASAQLETARARRVDDSLSRTEVLAAEAEAVRAQASLDLAVANRAQKQVAGSEVDKARANLRQLESTLEQARLRLSYATVLAPMSGLVTKRAVEPGELVMSGVASFAAGTPLVTIADVSQMKVRVSLNEVDVAKVAVGQPSEIRTDAIAAVSFAGKVTRISPAAEKSASGGQGQQGNIPKFEVEIAVLSHDQRLRPGISAEIDILAADRQKVLFVPPEAIQDRDDRHFVKLIQEGKDVEREVTIGVSTLERVEIISGLKEGDRVRLSGAAARKLIPMEEAIRRERRQRNQA